MKPIVYISCPVDMPVSHLEEVARIVNRSGAKASYWIRRGPYYDSWLDNADAVVFIAPNNNWGTCVPDLPSGVRREYRRARASGKPIFLAYRSTVHDTVQLYETTGNDSVLCGVSGTYGEFDQWVDGYTKLASKGLIDKDEDDWVQDINGTPRKSKVINELIGIPVQEVTIVLDDSAPKYDRRLLLLV